MLKVFTFGEFAIYKEDKKIESFKSRKAMELFKFLLLNKNKKVPLLDIYDIFWPGFDDESARLNLNTTLYYIRKQLDISSEELGIKEDYCLFSMKDIYIDFEEFLKLYDEAFKEKEINRRLFLLLKASSLYKGDLFDENVYDEWVRDQKEYFKRLYIDVLLEIGYLYEQLKDKIDAQYYLQKAFYYSQREDAWLSLIRIYENNHEKDKAISLFNQYKEFFGYNEYPVSQKNVNYSTLETPNIERNGNVLSLDLFNIILDLERLKRDKDYVMIELKLKKKVDKSILDKFCEQIRREDVIYFGGDELKIIFRGIKDVKEKGEKGFEEYLNRPDVKDAIEVFPIIDPVEGYPVIKLDVGEPIIVLQIDKEEENKKDTSNILEGRVISKELIPSTSYLFLKIDLGRYGIGKTIVHQDLKISIDQKKLQILRKARDTKENEEQKIIGDLFDNLQKDKRFYERRKISSLDIIIISGLSIIGILLIILIAVLLGAF
jgi:DNA-binding SARP family transcriptional activator